MVVRRTVLILSKFLLSQGLSEFLWWSYWIDKTFSSDQYENSMSLNNFSYISHKSVQWMYQFTIAETNINFINSTWIYVYKIKMKYKELW